MESQYNTFCIGDSEKLYVDGTELKNVTNYKLVRSAGSSAELTVTLEVKVGQFGSEPKK